MTSTSGGLKNSPPLRSFFEATTLDFPELQNFAISKLINLAKWNDLSLNLDFPEIAVDFPSLAIPFRGPGRARDPL